MNSKRSILAVAVAALLSLALSSCSGLKNKCTVNCGGGTGNASLNITLGAEPLTPPPGTSILSFAVVINSVSLAPSGGGSDVTIPLNNSSLGVDLTRLTSDSAYLGQSISNVPAATYTGLSVNASALVTYCTATSGTPGCNANSIAQISKSFTTPTVPNFSLILAANQQAGLRIVINFNNALTVSNQAVTGLDLTLANVLSTVTLPPANSTLSAGQLDYVEDVTGVVTAASSSSVTIQTATLGSITSTITGSSAISANCVILSPTQTCPTIPAVGQVASLDGTLNADGTSTLLQYDALTPASVDLIEGVVPTQTTSTTQFQLVTNNYLAATSNSVIGSKLNLGDTVNVTLSNSVLPFVIDNQSLTSFGNFSGNSATVIQPGMTVMVLVTSFTARSGTTPASATVSAVALRFTRVPLNVFSAPSPYFSAQSLPPFFGLTGQPQVELSTGTPSTNLDGYTSTSDITAGDNVSIRALYFGSGITPAFGAMKVRKN